MPEDQNSQIQPQTTVKPHDSIRGYFAYYLLKAMELDETIVVITCDLGYGMFDQIKAKFPDRFINVGSSEQAGTGIAVGMALEGKKPFVYSITPFLIYRAFETIRNYVDHEKIPVRLIGSGLNNDYAHDGYSHQVDEMVLLNLVKTQLPNVPWYFPNKEDSQEVVEYLVKNNRPTICILRR